MITKILNFEQFYFFQFKQCIITNQRIMFIKSSEYEYSILYEVAYNELRGTTVKEVGGQTTLEICMETDDSKLSSEKFKFENRVIANSLANKIRFGKADYDETFYSLSNYKDDDD